MLFLCAQDHVRGRQLRRLGVSRSLIWIAFYKLVILQSHLGSLWTHQLVTRRRQLKFAVVLFKTVHRWADLLWSFVSFAVLLRIWWRQGRALSQSTFIMRHSCLVLLVLRCLVSVVKVERPCGLHLLALIRLILNLPGKPLTVRASTDVILSVIHLIKSELHLIAVYWFLILQINLHSRRLIWRRYHSVQGRCLKISLHDCLPLGIAISLGIGLVASLKEIEQLGWTLNEQRVWSAGYCIQLYRLFATVDFYT